MGEYADELIDRMIDGHWGRRPRRNRAVHRDVTCQRCGKTGLRWRERPDGSFKLVDPNAEKGKRLKTHRCQEINPKTADDFDDLDAPQPATKEQIAERVYASVDKMPFLLPLGDLYRLWGNERGGGMMENALARFIHDLERPDLEIKTHWQRPHTTVRVSVSSIGGDELCHAD